MKKVFGLLCIILNISCQSTDPNENKSIQDSTKSLAVEKKVGDSNYITEGKNNVVANKMMTKIERLSKEEINFLNKIAQENEFLVISDLAERRYSEDGKELIMSKLIIQKDTLDTKGYVFYELKFYGKISDVNIYYSYNLGQGSYGFGSIVGSETTNYFHTLQSCGVTNCISQVFHNGQKIFEEVGK